MATDPDMLAFMVGIGIRRFSVEPRMIPFVQESIENLDVSACAAFSAHLLSLGRISDVKAALKKR
jgi:phosphoenolpyruvate-protein kinase (PTS system EI component)